MFYFQMYSFLFQRNFIGPEPIDPQSFMEGYSDTDDGLKGIFKASYIPKLYKKLDRASVTFNILWKVTNDQN